MTIERRELMSNGLFDYCFESEREKGEERKKKRGRERKRGEREREERDKDFCWNMSSHYDEIIILLCKT